MITLELQRVNCSACDGNGWTVYSGMGSDNMDVWAEIDVCASCDGHGYDDVELVAVDHGADIDPAIP